MSRRTLLSIALLAFAWSALWAQGRPRGQWGQPQQPAIKGKISATVVDSITGQPVEFATAVLIDPKTGKEINGQISDEKGHVRMIEIPAGSYELVITFLGYEDRRIPVVLTPEKPDADLETVYLLPTGISLDEVTVTAEAAVVENKVDRIVYNAEKDVANRGGDASDVLRRVPLLSVDLEGNVSLRGSSNILILINGRPSGMFASSVADALKMIPADEIKSVEVITSPTAKYDGEGSAGIINIITKKKTAEGISGNVNVSAGTRLNNAVLGLSAAKGRGGVNINGSMFYAPPRPGEMTFYRRDNVNGADRILDQSGDSEAARLGFGGNAGAFYDFNAYNGITTRLNYRGFNQMTKMNTEALIIDPSLTENQMYQRLSDLDALRYSYDWNTDFRRTWPDSKREWVVGFQVSGNVNDTRNDISIDGTPDALDYAEKALNNGDNLELTAQTDYTHPFSKKVLLETGLKAVRRNITSDYDYQIFDSTAMGFVPDLGRSDVFHYLQDVAAAYASFNLELGQKWGLVAGARYEHTLISGNFDSDGSSFENEYGNLLPSFIVSRKLKNFQQLRLAYTRRIQRPSLFYINPFSNNTDQRVVQVGNPYLSPEVTDQVELSLNTRLKGVMLNLATYYKQTRDVIESFLEVTPEGVSVTTFRNIGQNRSIGANLFASTTIAEKLTLRGGFNLFTYNVSATIDGKQLSNEAIQYNGNLNASVSLPKGFRAEMFGFWNSPRLTLQGRNPSFSIYGFGLVKEVLQKKGQLGLRIVEPFNKFKYFKSELEGDTFYQRSSFGIPFRSIGINFSYRFGKMEFNPQSKLRSRVKNDDLKQGDNQGGGNF